MKISRIFAAMCLLMVVFACQSNGKKTTVTLVQYNVGVFAKYDSSSVAAVANAVKELNADAVTFNEVDSCTTRTGSVDQMAAFAQEMGGWNQHYAAINILELTVGDIASYKDAEDLQKRLAELHAPGIRANVEATDFDGNRVADSKTRTVKKFK